MKITNIEQIVNTHFDEGHDLFTPEMYVIYYTSGREKMCLNYDELPETAKAFMRTHFNIAVKTPTATKYIYKAYNIIK